MPTFRVTSPDGKVYEVTAPEGATEQEVLSRIQSQNQPAGNDYGFFGGVLRGARDVVDGGAQLLARGVEAAIPDSWETADRWAKNEVARVEGINRNAEQDYQQNWRGGGVRGVDWGRVTGNIAALAPMSVAAGGGSALSMGLRGAASGAVAGGFTPVLDSESFWDDKLAQAGVGGLFGFGGGLAGKGLNKAGQLLAGRREARQVANATKDAVVQRSREAGYVVPPSDTNAGFFRGLLDSFGGKIKTQQAASKQNQEVTNRLVKETFGIEPDAPLSSESLAAIRGTLGRAWDALRGTGGVQLDDTFKATVQQITRPAEAATKAFPKLSRSGYIDDIKALLEPSVAGADEMVDVLHVLRDKADTAFKLDDAAGRAYRDAAKAIEEQLERHLQSLGAPAGTIDKFRLARKLYAQTYTAEKALNKATGNVDASVLGNRLKSGKPLDGPMRTAAEFQQSFPKAAQLADKMAGVSAYSPLDLVGAGALGTSGALFGGPIGGTIGIAAQASRPLLRSAALSSPVQSGLVPSYAPSLLERGTQALSPELAGLLGYGMYRAQQ